jgi:hypothetical protein
VDGKGGLEMKINWQEWESRSEALLGHEEYVRCMSNFPWIACENCDTYVSTGGDLFAIYHWRNAPQYILIENDCPEGEQDFEANVWIWRDGEWEVEKGKKYFARFLK